MGIKLYLVSILFSLIFPLVAVAFITLLERKILGYMQIRKGPNKIGTSGILQPMADAVKLYVKEVNWPTTSNSLTFFMSPCLSLSLALTIWMTLPFLNSVMTMNYCFLLFLCILGVGVYPILISGWSSNSSYSLIGGMRALAQTISYEVSLIFVIIGNLLMCSTLNLMKMSTLQKLFCFSLFLFSTLLWLVSVVAEMNRTPFDFAEGESELVSGFNTEYSSGSFAMIFMAEYMMILFFSILTSYMFLSSSMIFFSSMMFMFLFIWTRASFPRYRYDKLMSMCWKMILPSSIFILYEAISSLVIFG